MAVQDPDAKEIELREKEARERIAARINALRTEHEYTLSFIADAAQIGRGHLSNIFAGKANMTLGTLVRLAYALDVDVADLLRPSPGVPPRFKRGRPRTRRIRT